MKRIFISMAMSICIILLAIAPVAAQTQEPSLIWSAVIGGTQDDIFSSVCAVEDGYVAVGETRSFGGLLLQGKTNIPEQGYFAKYSKDGQLIFSTTLGGNKIDTLNCVISTSDGGLLAIGASASKNGLPETPDYEKVWVLKLDGEGVIQWQKSLGSARASYGFCAAEVEGKGYYIAGSVGQGFANHQGGAHDVYLTFFDDYGLQTFETVFGGKGEDIAYAIKATKDGGCVIAGSTTSQNSGDVYASNGGMDAWVIKAGDEGQLQWAKVFGGEYDDAAFAVDIFHGGYVVAGERSINKDDKYPDAFLFTIDQRGELIAAAEIETAGEGSLKGVMVAPDGITAVGYQDVASSKAADDKTPEIFIVTADYELKNVKEYSLPAAKADALNAVCSADDGGIIAAGYTASQELGAEYGKKDALIMHINIK